MAIEKPKKFHLNWSWIIIGMIALSFIKLIPFAGGLIGFILFLVTWGAITSVKWKTAKKI